MGYVIARRIFKALLICLTLLAIPLAAITLICSFDLPVLAEYVGRRHELFQGHGSP